jgi:hypothetical protein
MEIRIRPSGAFIQTMSLSQTPSLIFARIACSVYPDIAGSSRLLSAAQLMQVTGYERFGDLTRSLDQQGIRYFIGKGGRPWTTVDLVNAAGGLNPDGQSSREQYYGVDIL